MAHVREQVSRKLLTAVRTSLFYCREDYLLFSFLSLFLCENKVFFIPKNKNELHDFKARMSKGEKSLQVCPCFFILKGEYNMKKVLNVVKPILSIVLALLVGAIVIWAIGENPIQIYQVMLSGSLSSVYSISETLLKATTLIFCGLSYAFAYKCGLINIGTEGQLHMGALFSTIISVYVKLPMLIHKLSLIHI